MDPFFSELARNAPPAVPAHKKVRIPVPRRREAGAVLVNITALPQEWRRHLARLLKQHNPALLDLLQSADVQTIYSSELFPGSEIWVDEAQLPEDWDVSNPQSNS